MGTLPGWNRKEGLLGNHFLAILQKHGKKICYNTRRINVTLTMPTALLRWDPDLQPGNRSSDDAAGGSVLQNVDQHKMSLSFNPIAALSTIENWAFFLTLNQKYWRAASRLSRLIFCWLFGMWSLFWQTRAHYCSTQLAEGKHSKMW